MPITAMALIIEALPRRLLPILRCRAALSCAVIPWFSQVWARTVVFRNERQQGLADAEVGFGRSAFTKYIEELGF